MKIFGFICLFLLGIEHPGISQQCDLHPPTNLYVTNITSCSAILHWTPYSGASEYKVRYKPESASGWSPTLSVGLDTSYLFTGLGADSTYILSVRSFCSDGSKSELIKITITTAVCTMPLSTTVHPVNSNTSKVTINTVCPAEDTIYFRYGLTGQPMTLYFTLDPNSIFLTGLVDGSKYRYQISTCPIGLNSWTPQKTFKFKEPKPNVLLILLDDSRYDYYSCNGAPSFFQTPSIDRIANEGVNFKNNFAVYALCAPSRACIVTGTYPSRTHVISNITSVNLNPDLPTLFGILHQKGYYTAMLGKIQNIFDYDEATFDYWLECLSNTDEDSLKIFSYFGDTAYKSEYITDVLTDSAMGVIQNSSKPFFIWLAYTATHDPLVPKPEDDGLYDTETMPLEADTAAYTTNYPSFLYSFLPRNYVVGDELTDLYSGTYEVMKNVDGNIGRILEELESSGKLDNTMIIFTSDNGHLFGEHHMNMKRLAYDPSIRTPLFIRYPKWFTPSSLVNNQITLNIDLAPTVLEVAGVTTSYNMDGTSLHQFYSGQQSRKEMYYHSFYTSENNYHNLAYAKAIRDLRYKYIYYGCMNNKTEEFFDLLHDPMEMFNIVNDPKYHDTIENFRNKIDSYGITYGDTVVETILNCYLTSPEQRLTDYTSGAVDFSIYPNPSDGKITVTSSSPYVTHVEITDLAGRLFFESDIVSGEQELYVSSLPSGSYSAIFSEGGKKTMLKLMIQ